MQTSPRPASPARRGRPEPRDGTPPGGTGKPLVVFLSPAQHEALVMHAEEQDEDPATLVRRSLRLYLHDLAAGADGGTR